MGSAYASTLLTMSHSRRERRAEPPLYHAAELGQEELHAGLGRSELPRPKQPLGFGECLPATRLHAGRASRAELTMQVKNTTTLKYNVPLVSGANFSAPFTMQSE